MRPASALACAAALLSSSAAYASPDLVLDGVQLELHGSKRFRVMSLTNGARVTVKPHDGGADTGFLQIVAHRVLIDAQSAIVATGSGFRGIVGNVGQGAGKGEGALTSAGPGGGAGYGGKGGFGVLLPGCEVDPAAKGGPMYAAGGDLVSRGSAGSAAALLGGEQSRGGNGGGAIDLQAGGLELLGSILADGEDGQPSTEASGGGSGGGIRIAAAVFATAGDSATLSARGAKGGVGALAEGGAGAGGRIHLLLAQTPPIVNVDAAPGASLCASAAAEPGQVKYFEPLPCPDMDNDGVLSDQCADTGPMDCDDTDPSVRPGIAENCNGVDDNCNGTVDEGAEASCGGSPCVNGHCMAQDAGVDAPESDASEEPEPADAAAHPDAAAEDVTVEGGTDLGSDGYTLRGGCAMSSGGNRSWGAVLLGMVAVAMRRRRPGRRAG